MEQFAVILIKHGIDFSYMKHEDNSYLISRDKKVEVNIYDDAIFVRNDGDVRRFMTQPEDIQEAAEYLESICEHLNK